MKEAEDIRNVPNNVIKTNRAVGGVWAPKYKPGTAVAKTKDDTRGLIIRFQSVKKLFIMLGNLFLCQFSCAKDPRRIERGKQKYGNTGMSRGD